KCLEKELPRRYASAAALADDLERWLAGEPIHARPVGPWEKLRKWARRRPAAAALVVLSTIGLVSLLALGGSLWDNAARRGRAVGGGGGRDRRPPRSRQGAGATAGGRGPGRGKARGGGVVGEAGSAYALRGRHAVRPCRLGDRERASPARLVGTLPAPTGR